MQYLMIDGHGDPNTSPAFPHPVERSTPVAYKLKFTSKRDLDRDYVVPPLEGLWWAEDMDPFTGARDRSRWDWTLMIMVPDWIDQARFAIAVEQAEAKDRPARLDDVRLGTLSEGRFDHHHLLPVSAPARPRDVVLRALVHRADARVVWPPGSDHLRSIEATGSRHQISPAGPSPAP